MATKPALFIGIMSGTSMDGIDVVLADFEDDGVRLHASAAINYPEVLSARLMLARTVSGELQVDELCQLDRLVGLAFANAALQLLDEHDVDPGDIVAIGSHGQTLRHRTDSDPAFSLQVGDPNTIAAVTKIQTVADFRRRDIALGGQGAPLACAFHQYLIAGRVNTGVLNLGGIANLTIFKTGEDVRGYDTGPASTLLDLVAQKRLGVEFDKDGESARAGQVDAVSLKKLLADPYFEKREPKSTGFEYFNERWLQEKLGSRLEAITTADLLATLTELTAASIAQSVDDGHNKLKEIFVCGGGVNNRFLLERLEILCSGSNIRSSSALGADPGWMEALAFAWLARETLSGRPGNLISVTGASEPAILGAIFAA
ncbi:MAG: anhydro-N-acetylmuramic acid kinase [Pseudomonadota bacterium]